LGVVVAVAVVAAAAAVAVPVVKNCDPKIIVVLMLGSCK
jgi:hypothetical protein